MSEQNLISKLEEDVQYAKATEQIMKEQGASLEELLKENLRYSRAIYADTQKIRRYMFIRLIFNIVWIVLILAPIIFALIYLPPALRQVYGGYQDLLGTGQSASDLFNQLNNLR